jgi:hypothetical protein
MKRGTAFHEAGHAVIAMRLGLSVDEASVVGGDERGSEGHVLLTPPINSTQPAILYAIACARIAGPIAESLFVGGFQVGGDAKAAFEKGHVSIKGWQSDLEFVPEFRKYSAVVFQGMVNIAIRQVAFHWEQIGTVAGELEKRQSLSGTDIIDALEATPIERLLFPYVSEPTTRTTRAQKPTTNKPEVGTKKAAVKKAISNKKA